MVIREGRDTGFGATPLGLLHTGTGYSVCVGQDFYGIWDAVNPTDPLERFPATAAGRQQALNRYFELEPSARPALTPPVEVDEEEGKRGRRRWIAAAAVLAV